MTQAKDLRDLTKDWFILLSTCRRQAAVLPADTEWMRVKLDALMTDMETGAQHDPLLVDALSKAKYPLVYLADDILLRSKWPGRKEWVGDLYETRLFGTRHAGVDFFERLERVAVGERLDLIEIYFRCICLGFRGMHLRSPDALNTIRRDLYMRLPKARVEAQLCPEAYASTDQRRFTKLPVVNAARIVIPLVALLFGVWLLGRVVTEKRLERIDNEAAQYVESGEDR